MACDVQSFGATLRVSKSCRAEEEAIPTQSRQKTDSWRLYLRHVWPHLCFSDWSLLTPPNSSSSSVTRDPSCRRLSPSSVSPAKMAEPIEMLFGLRTRVHEPREPCVRWWSVQIPHENAQFWEKRALIVKYRPTDFLP